MTPYTKKNTPISTLSTYEKRGVISVKDMSGCLTKVCEVLSGYLTSLLLCLPHTLIVFLFISL